MTTHMETSLVRSHLTGQILYRIAVVAESHDIVYAASITEGHGVFNTPGRYGKKLFNILAEASPVIDALYIAKDFDAFREGRAAPESRTIWWTLKTMLEGRTI